MIMIPHFSPVLVVGREDRIELAPAEVAQDGRVELHLLCWSPDEVLIVEQDLQQAFFYLEQSGQETNTERRLFVIVGL